jgi:hypothetical protein
MIIIVGLVILVAALVAGVAGVLGNGGSAHALPHGFSVLGYHLTGSTGTLFLYGIVLGAIGLFGLSLLLAGARRTSRRGSAARRGLRQSRRETAAVSQARDDLINQRETARAYTASELGDAEPSGGRHHSPAAARRRGPGMFSRRSASAPADAVTVQQPASNPVPIVPASGPAGDVPAAAPAPAAGSQKVSQP